LKRCTPPIWRACGWRSGAKKGDAFAAAALADKKLVEATLS